MSPTEAGFFIFTAMSILTKLAREVIKVQWYYKQTLLAIEHRKWCVMQQTRKLRIIQRSALRPTDKVIKEIDTPQRFIPLGDSHVRDISTFGEHPVNRCLVKSVYRNKNIYAATLEGTDVEVLFRVDHAYSMFLTDNDRIRGIVLTYQKELQKIDFLSATVRAIQLSFDPVLYIECMPLDMP